MCMLFLPLAVLPLASAESLLFSRQAACSANAASCVTSTATSCCVNKPGGLFVQTQFWDTDPVVGPSDSWTIHGLWPDNCDGTYDSNCDASRAYTSITNILQSFGKSALVTYMKTYWQANNRSPEDFWQHEWSSHGTCVSTLDPKCYTGYSKGEEAADYFQVTVDLFKKLNTYQALANAGITPSTSKTYTSSAIINALTKVTGKAPIILCQSGEFYQVYYGFHTNGPLTNANFAATTVAGTSSNCPASGVKYLPKAGASPGGPSAPPSSPSSTLGVPPPTATGVFSGSGNLDAYYNGNANGCLISGGTWYTTGSCATYNATPSGSGFTLRSSKGACGFESGVFRCASGVTASLFTASGGLLAYNGQTLFYSSVKPSGTTQGTVYTGTNAYPVSFKWKST
ncbi:Ribonuclease T2-like [Paramyrothecium foliicola]|nr:Ribonuclease T2-like [Paramyrothecium foliicola]